MEQNIDEGLPASQLNTLIKKNFLKINAALEEQRMLNRKPSQSSELTIDSSNRTNDFALDHRRGGNRTSIMSDYSGIIQQVDIDTIKYVNQDNDIDDQDVPLRSVRRFSVDAAKINRITASPLAPSGSPKRSGFNSSPPKTPLPPLMTKRSSSTDSSPSTKSLQLNTQLDDIMRVASNLHSELEVVGDENTKSSTATTARHSVSSTGNDSYHTAFDVGSQLELEQGSFGDGIESSPLAEKTERERVQSMSTIIAEEPKKKHRKHKKHHHGHHRRSKHSTSSDETGGSAKPFSYDSLSKLLDSTDGIAIGQEFSSLNIPVEERFLIERVVDSISRLTANMVINPERQDRTSDRLEKVLAVLENFD